jgi:hypothetical protein
VRKVTQHIIDRFPSFEDYLIEQKSIATPKKDDEDGAYQLKRHTGIEDLNEVERTFFMLARFFENPEEEGFDLIMLYTYLQDDWLEIALQLIASFFKEETHLIKNPSFSIVREDHEYLNQNQFAAYLNDQGLNYDRIKLNVYYKRGKLPEPDQMFAEKPYWLRSTVERFCEQEKRRVNTRKVDS